MPTMRSVWKGSLACSVLNVPVKLYSATEDKATVKFNQLSREHGTRIKQKKVAIDSNGDEHEVSGDEIIRVYELSKDNYIPVTDSDLEAVKLPSISSIDIVQFIDEVIDPRMAKKSMFIGPDKGGEKAFGLLLQTMFTSGKTAIAKVTMRDKEVITQIRWFQDPASQEECLLIQPLYWPEELRSSAGLFPVKPSLSHKELELATNLVDSMTSKWEPGEFMDEYSTALLNLIEDKAAGKPIIPSDSSPITPQSDLLSQLTASLEKVNA